MRFISVLPAQPGYSVKMPDATYEPVIAWGFDEFGNAPEPLTIYGSVVREILEVLYIKDPSGRVCVV